MKLRYYQNLFTLSFLCFGITGFALAQPAGTDSLQKAGLATDSSAISQKEPVRYIGFDTQDSTITTSAVSTIKGNELLKNFNVNLANKLYGRIAGLTVSQAGNEPGFDSPSLLGRGVNSYQGLNSAPLIIIDGFLGTFEQLVPEEIEEISLLKDASATAVYGFRGANGVLLITTKRGREGPLAVTFSSQFGFSQATDLPETLNAFDYVNLYNEAAVNDGIAPRFGTDAIEAYRTGSNPILFPNVNWYDEVLRKTAPVSNYNLNFKGGTNMVNYFLSLNAVNNQGLLKNFGDDDPQSTNSTYGRYNFRSNVEVNVNKRFSATLLLGGNVEDKFNPFQITAGGTFNTLSSLPPNAFPARIPNGSVEGGAAGLPIPDGSYGGSAAIENPLANLASRGLVQYTGRTLQSSFKLRHELDFITQGLSASGAVSFNSFFQGGSSRTKQVQRYIVSDNGGTPVFSRAIAEPNLTLVGSEFTVGQNRNYAVQGFLNYIRTFGKHDIAALLMYNSDSYDIERPQPTTSAANNALPYKTNGGASRITYVNNNRYVAEFSLGLMGSENFAKGNRYGFFPAGSVGWIASNEDFLKNSKTLTFLKFRGSYGLAGSDDIGGRFLFEQRYPSGGSYVFGTNATVFSLIEGRLANPDITWEKEKKANIGVDATIQNQFNVSVDFFNQDRYDILPLTAGGGNIPSYLGFNDLPLINQGKVNNKGFEAVLGYSSKPNNKLTIFAEANVFYAKNRIVFGGESFQANPGLLLSGRPINQPLGLVALGLFQTQEDVDASPKPVGANVRIGDIKYADIGGPLGVPDGIIDGNDARAIGNTGVPNLTVGFHSGIQYKGFDLDFVLQGVSQRTVTLGGNYFRPFQNANNSASAIALERWTPETASTAVFPRLSLNGNQNNNRFSSFYQRDGSFIKLRSTELGYSLPKSLTSKIRLTSGRVFINGTNLLSIDRVKYGDPEALGTGYPPMRTFSLGARIGL